MLARHFGVNAKAPAASSCRQREDLVHPINQEIDKLINIFYGMGFEAFESRQIDDGWHMFTSLNFPEDHPARDDYDTFITEEGLIAPAHTIYHAEPHLKFKKK
jgi:phenylalanyl-tRNA synthetase alpha subunit